MIDLIDFDISIRERMENIRLKANDDSNAKTFCSCYMWAKPMNIKLHLECDMYAVKNNSHGPSAWNFPVGGKKAKIDFIKRLAGIENLKLLKLSAQDVDFINKYYPSVFVIEEATDDSEYIYDAIEHNEMSGKRFGGLRRLVNQFNRQHSIKTEMLKRYNMPMAEKVMMMWGAAHKARGELSTSGTEVDRFIIDHYDEIGMIGILIYIDGIPSAVVMGYPISSDMCDIAEIKFIPTINNVGCIAVKEFMMSFGGTYRFFNYEEDMGIDGLREHKQRLKPCRMNVLYNAYLKGVEKV